MSPDLWMIIVFGGRFGGRFWFHKLCCGEGICKPCTLMLSLEQHLIGTMNYPPWSFWWGKYNVSAHNITWKYLIKNRSLTHWGRWTHICVTNLSHHFFRWWLVSWRAPSHHLNRCWNIVNWTLGMKLRWHLNRNLHFNSRKCIWNYCLGNVGHFVSASMC